MDLFRMDPRGTVLLLLLIVLWDGWNLQAQSSAGEIRIVVKDPSGAVVRVSGALRNLDTGTVRAFRTDARGTYDFSGLPSGRYSLRISKACTARQGGRDHRRRNRASPGEQPARQREKLGVTHRACAGRDR